MANEPHVEYSGGMGLFFIQPPMAKWKKSSHGLQVLSRLAVSKPQPEESVAWPEARSSTRASMAQQTKIASTAQPMRIDGFDMSTPEGEKRKWRTRSLAPAESDGKGARKSTQVSRSRRTV